MAKAKLKKELDKHFSLFIRLRDSDPKGFCECYTCGVRKFYKEMHNGHYVSRSYTPTRFDEKNCNVQCPGCNLFKEGAKDVYALNLIRDYGAGILEELSKLKNQIVKPDDVWYKEKIDYYKDQVEKFKKKKKLK